MNEDLLHRMAYVAKEFGETVWVENPSAVIQFLVWTEHGVDEALVGYDGEKITTHAGHEEGDSESNPKQT